MLPGLGQNVNSYSYYINLKFLWTKSEQTNPTAGFFGQNMIEYTNFEILTLKKQLQEKL
jgi:hypothetical protein